MGISTNIPSYNRKVGCSLRQASASNSLGNTSPGERYDELRRIENRYNGTVNHYFLCDRGVSAML